MYASEKFGLRPGHASEGGEFGPSPKTLSGRPRRAKVRAKRSKRLVKYQASTGEPIRSGPIDGSNSLYVHGRWDYVRVASVVALDAGNGSSGYFSNTSGTLGGEAVP